MIYSYIDTLLEKWVDWSDGFLSTPLDSNTNDLNTILGTTGADNPTRANEFFNIGFLNFKLTGSSTAFDNLRESKPVQSSLGYIAYLIGKSKNNAPDNQLIHNGFNALSTICLIQQYEQIGNRSISLSSIVFYLLEKFPIPIDCDERSYLRFLTAAMFCELNVRKNEFLNEIFLNETPTLRIIDRATNTTKSTFRSPNDIRQAISDMISLTGIVYEKGSVFFVGNHREVIPRGLFYTSFYYFKDFLYDFYSIESGNLLNNPFLTIYNTLENQNKIIDLKIIFSSNNKIQNLNTLMKTLEEGCLEAIKILGWSNQNNDSISSKNIIFYGAPGTGKSHKVKELVLGKEARTERVTFHPEYDYSSFVGGYKPTMYGDNIRYEFVPQAFTNIYVNSWNDLGNDYYLVIEEINRGNCAEIFGDIFQLLDRSNDYEITPSKELKEYLTIQFEGNPNIDGNKLVLPPNLNILATMNTSDQSLFPMDSAFKRRWDWEYIPINYEFSDDNQSSKFRVKISENESFSWLSFIKSVNEYIKQNDNLGMDKCIGNYFIKPVDEYIELDTFINKALFYLWNDVFKDEIEEQNIFKNKVTYEDFFPIEPTGIEKLKEILAYLNVEIKGSIAE